MKISKIAKIKNVGNFHSFESGNNNVLDFDKNNVIYALNGYGKTTLVSILKSLKVNNPNLILGRKTLGIEDNPECILDCGNSGKYIFNNDWKLNGKEEIKGKSEIIIFDDEFIANNLFAEKYEINHKKSIFKIILGADGVKKSINLSKLRAEKKKTEEELENCKRDFDLKHYSVDNYSKLDILKNDESEIEKNLNAVEKNIINCKNQEDLKIKSILSVVTFSEYDFDGLETILAKKINSEAHKKAQDKIAEYKKTYFENNEKAEDFLSVGIENAKEHCPFCHKSLEDCEELLNVYKNYFDESYKKIVEELNDCINSIDNWEIDLEFEKIKTSAENNSQLYKEWKRIIKDLPKYSSPQLKGCNFKKFKKDLSAIVKNKLKELNKDAESCEEYKNTTAGFKKTIDDYNKLVGEINEKIITFRDSLGVVNLDELQTQKNKLSDKKGRISEDENKKCENYKELVKKIGDLEKNINLTKEELAKYTKEIVDEYKGAINQKLQEIGVTSFELDTIKHRDGENANDAYVEIVLKILGKRIHMKDYKDEEPSFKNTISRGDKNSLAFAFFLAFLDKRNKSDAVIIFDDPLNSLDENRQNSTATEIKKLSNSVDQVIILTHKKDFVGDIFSKFKENDTKYFEIIKNKEGSSIKKIEIKDFLKREYEKIIEKLNDYLENGSGDISSGNLLNDIRKVFEYIFQIKYYIRLKNESRTVMTYDSLNDNFFSKGMLNDIKDDLIDLAGLSNNGSHWSETEMNAEQMKIKIRKTLEIIEKI